MAQYVYLECIFYFFSFPFCSFTNETPKRRNKKRKKGETDDDALTRKKRRREERKTKERMS